MRVMFGMCDGCEGVVGGGVKVYLELRIYFLWVSDTGKRAVVCSCGWRGLSFAILDGGGSVL